MHAAMITVRPRRPHPTPRTYLRLSGDVDLADRPALERLRADARHTIRLHVDLYRVRFAGSLLVEWLLAVRGVVDANDGRLTLDLLPPRVARLFRTLGLDGAFEITDSPVDVHPSPTGGEGSPVPCDVCA